MQKKSIIAILSAVVLMVVASLALVFTIGPKTSADSEEIPVLPESYLNIQLRHNGVNLNALLYGFTQDGELWIAEHEKYRVKIPTSEYAISIQDEAFNGCGGLIGIEIPSGVKSIHNRAFYGCSSLTDIILPESLEWIGDEAFKNCSGLTSIELPEGLFHLGDRAFSVCKNLTSVNIPSRLGTGYFGLRTFEGCSALTDVQFSEGVEKIGGLAFIGCSNLTSVKLPSTLRSFSDAFYGSGIKSIEIPANVTFVDWGAFDGCNNLTEIIVRNPDLMTKAELQSYASKLYYGAEQNTVSFVTNCDTTIDSRLIDFGGVTPEPTITLTKEHYTFAGWYSDEQYTKPFTFETPIKYDITLYAKWDADKFTVTFNSNGGSDVNSRQVDYGNNVQRPSNPSKTHYTLLNWLLNGVAYDFSTPVTSDITLVAEWVKNPIINFVTDGTAIAPREVTYNTTTTSPTSSKTGYKLLGWKLNGETFDFANTSITEDITLVAEWEKLCVVTFNSNGGSEVATQYIENNKYASFPQGVSKQYHNLVGWKLNGETFDFVNTPITEDITLVADWEIYTYEVIFDSNGGTAVPSQIVDHGAKVILPTDPTRDGYFFCGWYRLGYNYYGNYTVTEYDFETPVTEYMTLTAVWKNIYNVTFANANGEVYTTRAVVEGDLVQAPDITVDGYLVSWYAGDKAYDFTTPVTADMTLTAQLDENSVKVNNQNNSALIWGIAGTAAGILIIGGIVFGIVIAKRRRK